MKQSFTHSGFGKAYYPGNPVPLDAIVLDDTILDYRLQPQSFTVSGPPTDRLVIRKNFPETWIWNHNLAGYKLHETIKDMSRTQ